MQLKELVSKYALANDLSDKYVKHLYTSARGFVAFAGQVLIEEITVEQLNAWADCEAQIHHKLTAKNKLCSLVTLLKNTAEQGLRAPLNGTLNRLKVAANEVR